MATDDELRRLEANIVNRESEIFQFVQDEIAGRAAGTLTQVMDSPHRQEKPPMRATRRIVNKIPERKPPVPETLPIAPTRTELDAVPGALSEGVDGPQFTQAVVDADDNVITALVSDEEPIQAEAPDDTTIEATVQNIVLAAERAGDPVVTQQGATWLAGQIIEAIGPSTEKIDPVKMAGIINKIIPTPTLKVDPQLLEAAAQSRNPVALSELNPITDRFRTARPMLSEQGFIENFTNAWMLFSIIGQDTQRKRFRRERSTERYNERYGTIPEALDEMQKFYPFEDVEGFNPYKDADLRGYEEWASSFINARSADEVQFIKDHIDLNMTRRQELDIGGAGWSLFAAGILDPINLIPIPLALGGGFVRGAARGAMGMTLFSSAYELSVMAQDPTKTGAEAGTVVAASVLFGGALGGAVGMIGRRRFVRISKDIEESTDAQTRGKDIIAERIEEAEGSRPVDPPSEGPLQSREDFDRRQLAFVEMAEQFQTRVDDLKAKINELEGEAILASRESGVTIDPTHGAEGEIRLGDAALDDLYVRLAEDEELLAGALEGATRAFDGVVEESVSPIISARMAAERARRTEELLRKKLKGGEHRIAPTGTGLEWLLQWFQLPYYALKNNAFIGNLGEQIARTADELAGAPGLLMRGNRIDTATAQAVESFAAIWNGRWVKAVVEMDEIYFDYRGLSRKGGAISTTVQNLRDHALVGRVLGDSVGDDLSYGHFRELVSETMHTGKVPDATPPKAVKAVGEAAAAWRKFFDPFAEAGQALGMFGERRILQELNWREKQLLRKNNKLGRILAGVARDEEFTHQQAAAAIARVDQLRISQLSRKQYDFVQKLRAEIIEIEARVKVLLENAEAFNLEKIGGKTAGDPAWLHRIWRQDRIDADPEGLRNILYDHFRLVMANESDEVVQKVASETLSHIRKEAQYGAGQNKSSDFGFQPGPAQRRALTIPTEKVMAFIERDIQVIAQSYKRRMAPAIEMTRRYGDPLMEGRIAELEHQMDEIIAAARDKDFNALTREKNRVIEKIIILRDTVLGVHGLPDDPSAISVRTLNAAKGYAIILQMGKAWQVGVADAGRAVFAFGIRKMAGQMLANFSRQVGELKIGRAEGEILGELSEVRTAQRLQQLTSFGGIEGTLTRGERWIHANKGWMNILNLLGPWTDFLKGSVGTLAQSELIARSIKWGKGTITKQEREWLLHHGVDENQARIFVEQWEAAGGNVGKRLHLANTVEWTDEASVRVFRVAMLQEMRTAVVTPGAADRPSFMSKPLWSALLLYKQFGFSATQRILMAGLQQRDAQVLNGVIAMMAVGYMVDAARSSAFDQRSLFSPERALRAAELSGVSGIFLDINNILEVLSANAIGIRPLFNMPPFMNDPNFARRAGSVAGASAMPWINIAWAMLSPNADGSDIANAVRRVSPYNNLWIWTSWFDRVTKETGDLLDGIGDE